MEKTPILKFEVSVKEHDTKEPASNDKPDVFTVTMKSFDKALKIGLEEAKVQLKIKALDDIVKHKFPLFGTFVVEIYQKTRPKPVQEEKPTEQTPLDSSASEEEGEKEA